MNVAKLLLTCSALMLAAKLDAAVDLKNGNFYIAYTDLSAQDGLEVTRTYNSTSTHVGIFGFGWGSKFESVLEIGPDGLPVILSNGNGRALYFEKLGTTAIDGEALRRSNKEIVSILLAEENKKRPTPLDGRELKNLEQSYEKKLKDRSFAFHSWHRLVSEGRVRPIAVAMGEKFVAHCGCSFKKYELQRTPTGYQAIGGKYVEEFDNSGKITSFYELGASSPIRIERYTSGDLKGKVLQASRAGDTVRFFYGGNGFVDSVKLIESGKSATYKYSNSDLIQNTNSSGTVYIHEYDSQHNMTKIRYIDGTSMQINYTPEGWASELIDRAGAKTNYRYGSLDENKELNYFTEVIQDSTVGIMAIQRRERVEFRHGLGENGEIHMNSKKISADGIEKTYQFNSKGVLQSSTERSALADIEETTEFFFDDDGRAVKIKRNGWQRNLKYSGNSQRIESVITSFGPDRKQEQFEYDLMGRLTRAKSTGFVIEILYASIAPSKIEKIVGDFGELSFIRMDSKLIAIELNSKRGKETVSIEKSKAGRYNFSDDKILAYRVAGLLSGVASVFGRAHAELLL